MFSTLAVLITSIGVGSFEPVIEYGLKRVIGEKLTRLEVLKMGLSFGITVPVL